MSDKLLIVTLALACLALAYVDAYFAGQDRAKQDQQARRIAYCMASGHSETLCHSWGL